MCNYPLSLFRFNDGTSKICPTGTKSISYKGVTYSEPLLVPCGKCIECRLDYSRSWSFRMMCELDYHSCASFLTLTYDDEHVPVSESNLLHKSLRKKDVQDFIKRLRKRLPDIRLSYYCCGEYGGRTMRPHYHMVLFGFYPDDAVFYKVNKFGDVMVKSAFLDSVWKQGFITVGEVNKKTCGYVARYCTKKQVGINAVSTYDVFGIERPFSLSSKRPAIGRRWIDENIDKIANFERVTIPTEDGSFSIKPPKYFYDILSLTCPDIFAKIQLNNEVNAYLMSTVPRPDGLHGDYLYDYDEDASYQKLKKLGDRGDI